MSYLACKDCNRSLEKAAASRAKEAAPNTVKADAPQDTLESLVIEYVPVVNKRFNPLV